MKKILIVLFVLTMSGCAGVADSLDKAANTGQLTSSKDFEGNYQSIVTPTYLNDGGSFNNAVRLGAYYNESIPDTIVLRLVYGSSTNNETIYTDIKGISIKINGKVKRFDSGISNYNHSNWNSVSKSIFTKSESLVTIPFSLFEKMVKEKNCKLRIHTSNGYEEADFTIERNSGQALAKLAFIKLYDDIKTHKKGR